MEHSNSNPGPGRVGATAPRTATACSSPRRLTPALASSSPRRLPPAATASIIAPAPSAAIASTTPCRPATAANSSPATSSSSSSVVILKPEDLLDTADSAAVDSRIRWKGAAGTKSTFVLDQPRDSARYCIPAQYTLVPAKEDWVACDMPASKYHKEDKVICVYAAAFEAGMRLPFHDLHAAVLQQYGLAPSQLMPNAWRYLNAFVLLCEDAKVQPALPVFLFFFALCADQAEKDADKKGESARKKGQSTGRYHFKPYRYLLPPSEPDSGTGHGRCTRGRLFTGKMPQSPWKDRFFFIQGPSWPCPIKWGTPSGASIKEPVLTSDMIDAIKVLAHRAGHTGKDIMSFLIGHKHNLPVGHLQIPDTATPQLVPVKQEANAAAALTELTRKRKSPEPISPLPALSQPLQSWTGYDNRSRESAPAPAGVGLGSSPLLRRPVTGAERSCFLQRLHDFAQEASADFHAKEQELQMAKAQHKADVQALVAAKAQHEAALEAANTKHAADLDQLQEKQEELQKAVQDAYDKGRRDMQKHLVDLLSDSSLPPVDDQ